MLRSVHSTYQVQCYNDQKLNGTTHERILYMLYKFKLCFTVNQQSKVSIIRTLLKALSLIGLFLFEGGSAQFAGGFIISISSMVPGGFYLASFAMMGFLRRVLNYLSSTWNDFWYRNRSWCNRICVVIPKGMIYSRPNKFRKS